MEKVRDGDFWGSRLHRFSKVLSRHLIGLILSMRKDSYLPLFRYFFETCFVENKNQTDKKRAFYFGNTVR